MQLLDGLSMQFTQVLFKQYVRRHKDGTTRNCRSANIWLRERVKWVRSLVMALPVDAQHLRDGDEGRRRVAHQFANQTAAIWKNIESRTAPPAELDLMETAGSHQATCRPVGIRRQDTRTSNQRAQENWILSVMVRLLSRQVVGEAGVNRCWDRLQEHIAILLGKVRRGVSAYVSNATMKVVRERKQAP